MRPPAIISDGQALAILRNDLRRKVLEARPSELSEASPEVRNRARQEIEMEIENELKRRRAYRSRWFHVLPLL